MSNKYKKLSEKLSANHAICAGIEAELKTMQPPEMWVCFFKDDYKHNLTAFPTEKEAKEHCAIIVEKVVRYVLPTQEQAAPIKDASKGSPEILLKP
jgi:hypothetical protein